MGKIILSDTSLCSIVRDEIMNPAGGIKRFIESHVPYVEHAVIVDTGSVDGTREVLEELESKYSNLKIYDHKFKGFANARNYSLTKVPTKYSLVLDADELITSKTPENEWEKIEKMEKSPDELCFNFKFKHINFNGNIANSLSWRERMFLSNKMKFEKSLWEHNNLYSPRCTIATIYHFLPSEEGRKNKEKNLYKNFEPMIFGEILSKTKGFKSWKKYNEHRDNYE